MLCQKCGKGVQQGTTYCSNFGNPVSPVQSGPPVPPTTFPQSQTYQKASHKARNIAIVIGIIVVIFVFGVIGETLANPGYTVTVTGMNVTLDYAGSSIGYFGANSQGIQNSNGLVTLHTGQTYIETFSFRNGDSLLSHTINQITVQTSGFSLVSSDPALPITISASGSTQITLTFDIPSHAYDGAIAITIISNN